MRFVFSILVPAQLGSAGEVAAYPEQPIITGRQVVWLMYDNFWISDHLETRLSVPDLIRLSENER